MMRVDRLIEILQRFPGDWNARAYEGEKCGIIVEESDDWDAAGCVIFAHASEKNGSPDFCRGCEPKI